MLLEPWRLRELVVRVLPVELVLVVVPCLLVVVPVDLLLVVLPHLVWGPCAVMEIYSVVMGLPVEGLVLVQLLVCGWCVGCVMGLVVALEAGSPMLHVGGLLVVLVVLVAP